MRGTTRGLLLVGVSALTFGVTPMLTVLIYRGGCNASTLLLLRHLIGLPVFLLLAGESVARVARGRALGLTGLALLCCTVTPLLLALAYLHLASGMVTTLHFVYPMFTFLLDTALFGVPLRARGLLCCAACTLGVFLLQGGTAGAGDPLGIALALASGLSYALYIVLFDRSGFSALDPFAVAGWYYLVSAAASFLLCLKDGFTLLLPAGTWAILCLYAVVIALGGTVAFQLGIGLVGGREAALFSCLEPVISVLLGAAFLRERVTAAALAGASAIVVSVTAATLSGLGEPADKAPSRTGAGGSEEAGTDRRCGK